MRSGLLKLAWVAVFLFGAWPAAAQSPPSLGSAASFAVLGGSAVTNTGATTIAGNVGVSPGTAVTGFPPGNVILGDVVSKEIAAAAQRDNAAVYADLSGRTCSAGTTTLTGTLAPGVYCVAAPAVLSGVLTLKAGTDPDAVWIFKVTGALTTDPDSSVLVTNGGKEGNVFWQTESATLGAASTFTGNLLARTSITLGANTGVSGRLLAQTGAVTLNENSVTICCELVTLFPSTLPDGTVGKAWSATITASGGKPAYTFRLLAGPPGMTLSSAGATATLSWTPAATGTFKATVVVSDSQGFSCIRVYTIGVGCPAIDLSPLDPPRLAVCATYTRTISASGGTGPYVFTGVPGCGLSLSSSGVLSSSALPAGVCTFAVTAVDATGCSGTRTYTLIVTPATINPAALDDGTVGKDYSVPISVDPAGNYEFTATGLPEKLDVVGSAIAGTPLTAGTFEVGITAVERTSRCVAGRRDYTLRIHPKIIVVPSFPPGKECVPYSHTVKPDGGVAPYTVKIPPDALPPGLTPSGDLVSGTPTAEGTYSGTLLVTDAFGFSALVPFTIVIAPSAIVLSPETLPPAFVGTQYCETITASGAGGSYLFEAAGLLEGFSLTKTGLDTAEICATPMFVGRVGFTVIATDTTKSCSGSRDYTIYVACPAITITPPALPTGEIGVPYPTTQLNATPEIGKFTFLRTAGPLPPGLVLSEGGEISGTPTNSGTYAFTVTATGPGPCSGTRDYTIIIREPRVPGADGAPALSEWGMLALIALLVVAALLSLRRLGV